MQELWVLTSRFLVFMLNLDLCFAEVFRLVMSNEFLVNRRAKPEEWLGGHLGNFKILNLVILVQDLCMYFGRVFMVIRKDSSCLSHE